MWLLKYDFLKTKYMINIKGIITVGSHKCHDEMAAYNPTGVAKKAIWIEALSHLVEASRRNYPGIYILNELIGIKDGEDVELIETNNGGASSSTFEMKTHKKHHPDVWETARHTLITTRLDTVLEKNRAHMLSQHGIQLDNVNFIKLDIQGMELDALKSLGEKLLSQIDYVYTKVFTEQVYDSVPQLADIDAFMQSKGFDRLEVKMTLQGWGEAFYRRRLLSLSLASSSSSPSSFSSSSSSSVPAPMAVPVINTFDHSDSKRGHACSETITVTYESKMNVNDNLYKIMTTPGTDHFLTKQRPGLVEHPESFVRKINMFQTNLNIWGFELTDKTGFKRKDDWQQLLTKSTDATQKIAALDKVASLLGKTNVLINEARASDLKLFSDDTSVFLFQSDSEKLGSNCIDGEKLKVQPLALGQYRHKNLTIPADEFIQGENLRFVDYLCLRRDPSLRQDLMPILEGAIMSLYHTRAVHFELETESMSQRKTIQELLESKGFLVFAAVCVDGHLKYLEDGLFAGDVRFLSVVALRHFCVLQ